LPVPRLAPAIQPCLRGGRLCRLGPSPSSPFAFPGGRLCYGHHGPVAPLPRHLPRRPLWSCVFAAARGGLPSPSSSPGPALRSSFICRAVRARSGPCAAAPLARGWVRTLHLLVCPCDPRGLAWSAAVLACCAPRGRLCGQWCSATASRVSTRPLCGPVSAEPGVPAPFPLPPSSCEHRRGVSLYLSAFRPVFSPRLRAVLAM